MFRKIAKLHIVLLFLFVQLVNTASSQEKKYSDEIEKKINEVENNLGLWVQIEGATNKNSLKDRMAFYHINGVSIAVIKNYKLEWARGYGWADSAKQTPVTNATLFQAGSISKSLNGVGVLKLAQDKKLDLYADINGYLKTWKFPYDSVSRGKKITTANLLSHTAGLTVHGFPGYENGTTIPSVPDILDGKKPQVNTAAVRSAFEPGLKFQYSGGGTTISQLMLADITGKAYEVWMFDNILKPLGMNNSTYSQSTSTDKEKWKATAYYNDGKPVKGQYHIYPEMGAAGLWTNPTDLAAYIIETQLALAGKSSKVLSPETTKLRLTPYIDSSAALGVFIVKKGDQRYFQHGGVDEGFVSVYYGSMENGNGVVVMVNSYNTGILNEIVNSVAKVYDWKGFYAPQTKKTVKVNREILQSYEGKYHVGNSDLLITAESDGLVLFQGDNKMNMYFISDTDFFLFESPESTFSFTKDNNNKIDGFDQKRGTNVYKIKRVD
ncbi:serine hydrolase domain-containing protein [Pollutibacter soli]|uniref:serine hydrolase domain-containing protein n=1 Tax=Pollutibacter soli TaxID=3034157 RepID=UPI003013BF8A